MNKASSSTKSHPEEAEILCELPAGNPRVQGKESSLGVKRASYHLCSASHEVSKHTRATQPQVTKNQFSKAKSELIVLCVSKVYGG